MGHGFHLVGFVAISALSACSEDRPVTPLFFEEKTGLPLCQSANLQNLRVGDYDSETDFTYGVILEMSDECRRGLYSEIEARLGHRCRASQSCRFMDKNSWSYELDPMPDGKIRFILRAI